MIPFGFVVGELYGATIAGMGATTCFGTLVGRWEKNWIYTEGFKSIVELSFCMAIIGAIVGGSVAGINDDFAAFFIPFGFIFGWLPVFFFGAYYQSFRVGLAAWLGLTFIICLILRSSIDGVGLGWIVGAIVGGSVAEGIGWWSEKKKMSKLKSESKEDLFEERKEGLGDTEKDESIEENKCNRCTTDNPESANYCHHCGKKIGEGTVAFKDFSGPQCSCGVYNPKEANYCFACGNQIGGRSKSKYSDKSKIRCGHCGTTNSTGSDYCKYCGEKLR